MNWIFSNSKWEDGEIELRLKGVNSNILISQNGFSTREEKPFRRISYRQTVHNVYNEIQISKAIINGTAFKNVMEKILENRNKSVNMNVSTFNTNVIRKAAFYVFLLEILNNMLIASSFILDLHQNSSKRA